ncbi:MAG: hypothetical protein M1321_00460 [Candidatus Marsarchaeota archaeon]|nr:hypothetical protein [Candidatus Marsarchaeota archaeon]
MRSRIFITALLFLLIGSAAAAGPTYCSDIFGNTNNIVSPAIYSSTTYSGLLQISLLIVLMVLVTLALLYGIGYGFGINKLVVFVKTEYVESLFNILLIVLIAGGLGTLNGLSGFFTNAALVGGTNTNEALYSSPGTMYATICNNLLNNQVIPAFRYYVYATAGSIFINFFASTQIYFQTSGSIAGSFWAVTVPSFIINPFAGLDFLSNLIGLQSTASVIMMALGIGMIFLFFALYFLFPVFLYLGILFRSFPWTRAAGGTLLSLFFSFYIIFPAIMYPITSMPNALPSALSSFSNNPLPTIGYIEPGTDILAYIQNDVLSTYNSGVNVETTLSFLVDGITEPYAVEVAYFAMILVGAFMAFLVSYDMSQILARALGAPSFNVSRIMGSVI